MEHYGTIKIAEEYLQKTAMEESPRYMLNKNSNLRKSISRLLIYYGQTGIHVLGLYVYIIYKHTFYKYL